MCANCETTIKAELRTLSAEKCWRCKGSGKYYGRGSVVNGRFEGFSGPCFGCQGKGKQTPEDVRRCTYYDSHHRRVAG